ncbi:MAG: hypothetical protein ACRES7_10680 [Gammaproteobacteria bacterium]
MTFKWLPDAEFDPHPRLAWLIECGFDLVVSTLYRKEKMLPPGYRLEPGTLIVSNHQRDSDVPVLTTVLCRREGVHIRWPLPFFVMREDLLQPHTLGNLLAEWPQPLPTLLGSIPLAWLFRIIRGEPMRRLREFSFGETLNSLLDAGLGAADPVTVFNNRGRREITAALGKLPLRLDQIDPRRLGKLRQSFWGLRRLRVASLQILKPEFRTTIAAQLARFAALLDAGRTVYFAPEGTISGTGKFGRIRIGTRRLYRLAAHPPPLLPLALSYDPLGPGRLRVIVHVGEALRNLDSSGERIFAVGLRHAIQRLYAVNPSHLIAHFLTAGPATFTTQEFAAWLRRAAATVSAAGFTLDPVLARSAPETLATERLAWLKRKKLVAREPAHWHNRYSRDAAPGWRKPPNVVRYLANALEDLAPELVRNLGP